ncbi:MAG TPA: hypothetical protein PKC28_09835 [Bdellovibrionales bacterium]|nr:hypothetical protein [Bdellovibrionales bacterium]
MQLKARNDIHLARRIWHFCGVMVMFTLYWFLNSRQALTLALVMSAFMIGFDVGRLYVPALNRIFSRTFRWVLRQGELDRISGAASMLAGVTLIIFLYPKNVVLLALLFVAIGDPVASYFGIRFGKDKLVGNKSLQGSLAAFAACFVISLGYYWAMDLMRERLFIVCLLSALIGAASELIPVGRLDDNIVFPVLSGTLLYGLFIIFGGL